MVLDGVLGQRHLACHGAGADAGGKQAKQFVLAGREGEGSAEQVEALGGGFLLKGDDEGRAAVFRRVWPVAEREPGGPQGEPEAVSEMRARVRRVVVDSGLGGEELGGYVVDAGRDGPFVGLG